VFVDRLGQRFEIFGAGFGFAAAEIGVLRTAAGDDLRARGFEQGVGDAATAAVEGVVDDGEIREVRADESLAWSAWSAMGSISRISPCSSAGRRSGSARLSTIFSVRSGRAGAPSSGMNLTPLYSGGLCEAVTISAHDSPRLTMA